MSLSEVKRVSLCGAFRVEEQLADEGVRLWAIDEPFEETFGSIVLRHVNVGLARGYLH